MRTVYETALGAHLGQPKKLEINASYGVMIDLVSVLFLFLSLIMPMFAFVFVRAFMIVREWIRMECIFLSCSPTRVLRKIKRERQVRRKRSEHQVMCRGGA